MNTINTRELLERDRLLRELFPEPEEPDEPEEEEPLTEEQEKAMDFLDVLWDKLDTFFDRAENAVDLIGDALIRASGGEPQAAAAEEEEQRRFRLIPGGIDPDRTDEFLDSLELELAEIDRLASMGEKGRSKITLMKEGIEADLVLPELEAADKGYDRSEVEDYLDALRTEVMKRWQLTEQ